MKLHIFQIKVSKGSEESGTFRFVHTEYIALRDESSLRTAALAIMEKYGGDEVHCVDDGTCTLVD